MINFSNPQISEINTLKLLWLRAFKENEEQLDYFFEEIFKPENTFVAKEKGKIVSVAYMLEATINGKKAGYLYALTTDASYRGKGIMTNLINYAVAESGVEICTVLPEENNLYNFYNKLGFRSVIHKDYIYTRDILKSYSKECIDENPLPSGYSQLRNSVLKKNFLCWNDNHIDFALNYQEAYYLKVIRKSYGYAIFQDETNPFNKNYCNVYEIIAEEKNMPYLINDILKKSVNDNFRIRFSNQQKPVPNYISAKKIKYGMIRNNAKAKINNVYMGLLLD